MKIIWKRQNSIFAYMWRYIYFLWLSPEMKQLREKLRFEFLHALNFSCTWNKKTLLSVNIVTLRRYLAYMVNSFFVSWDITIMINILQKIINVLLEEKWRAINLYWFHNDASEKNNLLNGHSNEPRISR